MAERTLSVSTKSGISAAVLIVALILIALAAVASKTDTTTALRSSDWAAVRFTLWQSFLSAAISTLLSVPIARALARRRFMGRTMLITLLGAPFILPIIVAVMGLLIIFGRNGWVNATLDFLGLPSFSIYGLHGVVLAHVFFNLPLATRLLLQSWQSVPAERFRLAAQVRLTPWAFFRVVEWPILKQTLPGVAALIFVICLTSFAVALTLGGGPKATTVELAIYQAFRFDFDLGRAALLSLIQLIVAGTAALLALWIIPAGLANAGQDRPVERWDTRGAIKGLLDGAAITLAAAFLLLPLIAILLRGVPGVWQMPTTVWQAAGSTLMVAFFSVLVMLALALPLAGWIASRRFGGVEAVGLVGLAASPLMIGTGWFIVINPMANPAGFALPVTALTNALMALPFCLRILVPQMKQTLQDFGRLSQTIGWRGAALWRWLIFPRLRSQLGFACGLTTALSVGDLGVIALFADTDRTTLPLQMYRLMGAYQMEAAAGTALLLLILALSLFWICDTLGRWHVTD